MSLWIYKNNNSTPEPGYSGDWYDAFQNAKHSRYGTCKWGASYVTGQPAAHKLALTAQVGQELLCWQRWDARPSYTLPPGMKAAAVGIMEIVEIRKRADGETSWRLRPVEQFPTPVPLLAYRNVDTHIQAIFRNPRQLGTFCELTQDEEKVVRRLCGIPRNPDGSPSGLIPAKGGPGTQKVGAGFGTDPVENAKIERAAVKITTRRLQGEGWRVTSVEKDGVGHDLVAKKKGKVRRNIEVKGVKGTKPEFFLTRNEADHAKSDSHWEIWIVTSALSARPKITTFPGRELLATHDFTPVSFRVTPVKA